jgi:hypothetical protein
MTDPKSVGKDLGRTKKEADRNIGRAKPNFPYSQRIVDDVDPYNTYKKEFNLGEGTTTSLDIDIKERQVPCSVNPPEVNSYIQTQWGGDYITGACHDWNEVGTMTNWRYLSTDSNTGEYLVAGGKIIIPYDGCYLVEVGWGGYGISYFEGGTYCSISVNKYSPSGTITLGSATTDVTGIIAILGPSLYYTPAPSRLIKMIEAKSGDKIAVHASVGGFHKCRDWYGTHLAGMGVFGNASLKVTLIALAEDIVITNKDGSPGISPSPTIPSTPPLTSEEAKQCVLSNRNLLILNDLLTFYNHLIAKGERPYPNETWTTEENWSNFWADYWDRLGWQSNTGEYPYPAPQTIVDLLAYQTEEFDSLSNCPVEENVYNVCSMVNNIGNQLQLLKNFYSSEFFPLYISISGSTEPTIFYSWETFWAWVWDRGYNMAIQAYDMELVWTEARNKLTGGITPWPPATTIGEISDYITLYTTNYSSGCQ